METEKIGFFKRVKMAIFNLEQYSIFANERFRKALKYLFLIVLISTFFLALASTIDISKDVEKLIDFIKSDEFPDFTLEDDELSSESILNSYDKEYNGRLIIDTTENLPEEKINEYRKQAKENSIYAILLKNKIYYRTGAVSADTVLDENNNDYEFEASYNTVTSLFNVKSLTKEKLVNDYLNDDMLFKVKMVLFVYAFMTILLLNILTLLEDIVIVGVFGWIASKISRVPLNFSKCMSLAIYSLTLSIILSTIYSIVYSFTGFEIKYFEVMYMIISYIYIVAAIMIMKEGNRTAGEAVTVEGEVLKPEEEKEDDNQEEDKKEKKKKLPKDEEKDKEEIPEDNGKNTEKKEENSKGEK